LERREEESTRGKDKERERERERKKERKKEREAWAASARKRSRAARSCGSIRGTRAIRFAAIGCSRFRGAPAGRPAYPSPQEGAVTLRPDLGNWRHCRGNRGIQARRERDSPERAPGIRDAKICRECRQKEEGT